MAIVVGKSATHVKDLPIHEGAVLKIRTPTYADRIKYDTLVGTRVGGDGFWSFLMGHLSGWTGIVDEAGKDLPYTPGTAQLVLSDAAIYEAVQKFVWDMYLNVAVPEAAAPEGGKASSPSPSPPT